LRSYSKGWSLEAVSIEVRAGIHELVAAVMGRWECEQLHSISLIPVASLSIAIGYRQ